MSFVSTQTGLWLVLLSLPLSVYAHEHHGTGEDPSGDLDALILIHMGFQFLVWCILFPVGMIYGFTRSVAIHTQLRSTDIDYLQREMACAPTGMPLSALIADISHPYL